MASNQRLLVVDDDPLIHRLVKARIDDLGVAITAASDGASGIAAAQTTCPHLILLDVGLPDMTGFTVCETLRDSPLTRDIPVIFLTGTDQPEDKVRAFEMGAVDYVTKPFNPAELRARVRSALRTQALLEALETQALSDALTGLPNRESFRRSLGRCLELARRPNSTSDFAVMFIDLDRFKIINDSLGHGVGDKLLCTVSNSLYDCVRLSASEAKSRRNDIVARLGGDEFAILLHDVTHADAAAHVAQRILNRLSQPYELDGHHVHCGASIGIRMCGGRGEQVDGVEELLRDADTAMYHAKSSGKGRFEFFREEMLEKAITRLYIEDRLRQAVRDNKLTLAYQPIVNLASGGLEGFEVLVRWHDGERGNVGPDEFIPVAEESGVIHDLGKWVLSQSCAQAFDWNQRFGTDMRMHVNLSKAQFMSSTFVEDFSEILAKSRLRPNLLTAEVTESVVMHDSRVIVPMLTSLRNLGVHLAMDDFGTGYSSLASLHRFPLNVLKIDREFIQRLSDSRPYAAIIQAIVSLAHNLDLVVVAEGVESVEEVCSLQSLDCDYAQGYYFNKPLTAEDAEAMLVADHAIKRAAA